MAAHTKFATLLLFTLTIGCAGKVNHDVLANVKRVGLLTVTVDRVGDQSTDAAVMAAVADFGVEEYSRLLGGTANWEFVPVAEYRDHPDFVGFSKASESKVIRAELQKLADSGDLTPADPKQAMAYMRAKLSGDAEAVKKIVQESVGGTAVQMERILSEKAAAYLAAQGMPVVPYTVLKPEGGTVTHKSGNAKKDPEERLRDVLLASIGGLAEELGLDAMAMVYLRTEVKATVGIGVITGTRGRDSIKMSPTLMLIAKDGQKAIDMGFPVIDGLSTANMGVPVYKIDYSDAGKRMHPKTKKKFDYVIDLQDPDGKVLVEYKALVTEAGDEFWEDVSEALVPKK